MNYIKLSIKKKNNQWYNYFIETDDCGKIDTYVAEKYPEADYSWQRIRTNSNNSAHDFIKI